MPTLKQSLTRKLPKSTCASLTICHQPAIVGRLAMFSSNIDSIETAKFVCGRYVQVKVALFCGAIGQDAHVCISSTMFKLIFRHDLNIPCRVIVLPKKL